MRWGFAVWQLSLAIIGVWRGVVLWRTRALLAEFGSELTPPMLALFVGMSVVCALGLGVATVGLWRRREWGRIPALIFIPLYVAMVQANTWLFVQSGLIWERRWVSLAVAIFAVGLAVGALMWRTSRRWLGFC